MHIQSHYPGTAPLATGHPQGLPEARRNDKPATRVQPIALSRDPEAALTRGQKPAAFWRAASGAPDPDQAAPPTMMQIRISRMLDAQRDAPPHPVADARPAPEEAAGYSMARSAVFSTLP